MFYHTHTHHSNFLDSPQFSFFLISPQSQIHGAAFLLVHAWSKFINVRHGHAVVNTTVNVCTLARLNHTPIILHIVLVKGSMESQHGVPNGMFPITSKPVILEQGCPTSRSRSTGRSRTGYQWTARWFQINNLLIRGGEHISGVSVKRLRASGFLLIGALHAQKVHSPVLLKQDDKVWHQINTTFSLMCHFFDARLAHLRPQAAEEFTIALRSLAMVQAANRTKRCWAGKLSLLLVVVWKKLIKSVLPTYCSLLLMSLSLC